MQRREFIIKSGLLTIGAHSGLSFIQDHQIMTVKGPINVTEMGKTLSHEHVLVDFAGADLYDPSQWDRDHVAKVVLPYLQELRDLGCRTFMEFTPEFLGRDPLLLKILSNRSGLNIVTNTGLYGAYDHKYLPKYAVNESYRELAARWINEFKHGINGTGIRPGFIKISVNPDSLTGLQQKLVKAAAITHLETGLTIASHTGLAAPAFEQLDIIQESGVDGSAFIWVHAQNENNKNTYLEAAQQGVWIGLDGLQKDQLPNYIKMIELMRDHEMLDKILISQDAGWYEPGKTWNGPKRDYRVVFNELIPRLKSINFSEPEIRQLLEVNPQEAFAIRKRKKSD